MPLERITQGSYIRTFLDRLSLHFYIYIHIIPPCIVISSAEIIFLLNFIWARTKVVLTLWNTICCNNYQVPHIACMHQGLLFHACIVCDNASWSSRARVHSCRNSEIQDINHVHFSNTCVLIAVAGKKRMRQLCNDPLLWLLSRRHCFWLPLARQIHWSSHN